MSPASFDRRDFLKLIGVAAAGTALAGCTTTKPNAAAPVPTLKDSPAANPRTCASVTGIVNS